MSTHAPTSTPERADISLASSSRLRTSANEDGSRGSSPSRASLRPYPPGEADADGLRGGLGSVSPQPGVSAPPSPRADAHQAHYSAQDERFIQQADSKYYAHQRPAHGQPNGAISGDEAGTPPHGSPRFDTHLQNSEAIDGGFVGGGSASEAPPNAELLELYASLQRCLQLRDRYIKLSCQRLEDNPRDYDGEFAPAPDSTTASFEPASRPDTSAAVQSSSREPRWSKWRINPPPPPAHWHKSSSTTKPVTERVVHAQDELDESAWDMPGRHMFEFALDDQGVFQVYDPADTQAPRRPLYDIPTLKQYYLDLECVHLRPIKLRGQVRDRRHLRRADQELRLAPAQVPREQVQHVLAAQRVHRARGDEARPASVRGCIALGLTGTATSTTSARSTRTSITRLA